MSTRSVGAAVKNPTLQTPLCDVPIDNIGSTEVDVAILHAFTKLFGMVLVEFIP